MTDAAEPAEIRLEINDTEAFRSALAKLEPLLLEPGAVLMRQGETGDAAYYLEQGSVRVFAESAYGHVPLATVHAPRLIGEIGVLAGLPRTASVEVISPSRVYRLSRAGMLAIGRETPDFLLSVIGQIGRQFDAVNKAIGLYSNALSALERRAFDSRILDDLTNLPPQLAEFSAAFQKFASQIVDKRRQHDELASAAIIQRSFLPRSGALDAVNPAPELHADMKPARDVGGDFYDFFMLDEQRLAMAIGDVCGKGIPASLFMAVAITALRSAAQEEASVQSAIARANASLCRDNAASMFATAFFAVLDLRSGVLDYCNCGHNAPVVMRASGEVIALPATGLPLALFDGKSAAAARVTLSAGDLLFLFTDGVTEAMSTSEEEYGEDRLLETLMAARALPPERIIQRIFESVDDFAQGAEQADDITCLAIRHRP